MLITLSRRHVRPPAPRTIDRAVAEMMADGDDDRAPMPTPVMAAIAAGVQLPSHRTLLREWAKGGVQHDHHDLLDEIDEAMRHGRRVDTERLAALRASIMETVTIASDDDEAADMEWFHTENGGQPRRRTGIGAFP